MEQETRTARDAGAPVKIGAEAVRAAAEVLRRYRAGKQNLDRRIIDNEQFWKLRHWEQMEKAGEGGNPEDVRPASGWLVNCILSKHADAMDCYPEPTVLPREPGDRQEAETLSRILPVLLKNDRFRRTYSKAWWDKLKSGCAVYGVFWDNEKLHGLGDVSIRSMDVLNLFWEPGEEGYVIDCRDGSDRTFVRLSCTDSEKAWAALNFSLPGCERIRAEGVPAGELAVITPYLSEQELENKLAALPDAQVVSRIRVADF